MATTNERLDATEKKVDGLIENVEKILSVIIPENTNKSDSDVIVEKLDAIQDSIDAPKFNEEILKNALAKFNDSAEELKNMFAKKTFSNEPTETEPVENKKFIRRMWLAIGISLIVSSVLSTWTFNNLLGAFPFVLGWFTFSLGTTAWLFVDEFMFEGYSIGRIGKNAVSLGITTIAISILFFTGITIGNSYISSRYGNDNEKPQPNIEASSKPNDNGQRNSNTEQQQPATSRSQGSVLSVPASQGTAQSEQ